MYHNFVTQKANIVLIICHKRVKAGQEMLKMEDDPTISDISLSTHSISGNRSIEDGRHIYCGTKW